MSLFYHLLFVCFLWFVFNNIQPHLFMCSLLNDLQLFIIIVLCIMQWPLTASGFAPRIGCTSELWVQSSEFTVRTVSAKSKTSFYLQSSCRLRIGHHYPGREWYPLTFNSSTAPSLHPNHNPTTAPQHKTLTPPHFLYIFFLGGELQSIFGGELQSVLS